MSKLGNNTIAAIIDVEKDYGSTEALRYVAGLLDGISEYLIVKVGRREAYTVLSSNADAIITPELPQ